MIEIKDQRTSELLHRIDADSLEDADLEGIYLGGADLVGMNCARANFRRAVLYEAHLDRVCLRGADLTHADLCGTLLESATQIGVVLEGARYDRGTQWPYGLLLHGHSVQLVVRASDTLEAARELIEEARRVRRQARELQVEVVRAQLTWKVSPDPEE